MTYLLIQGSLEEIQRQVLAVAAVVDNRKSTGWPALQADEMWRYIVHPELGTVCPKCSTYSGQEFNGKQIPIEFPYYTYNPSTNIHLIRPRTHQPDLSQYFYEECHCDLIWENAAKVLEKRLHAEKEAVL